MLVIDYYISSRCYIMTRSMHTGNNKLTYVKSKLFSYNTRKQHTRVDSKGKVL